MAWSIKHVSVTTRQFLLQNNAKNKLLHAKSIKLLIIVLLKIYKILNNKFSTTALLLLLFPSTEIFLFTRRDSIKFIPETKDFLPARQSKLLAGTLEMVRLVG